MFIVKPSRFPGIKLVYTYFVISVKEKYYDPGLDIDFIRFEYSLISSFNSEFSLNLMFC